MSFSVLAAETWRRHQDDAVDMNDTSVAAKEPCHDSFAAPLPYPYASVFSKWPDVSSLVPPPTTAACDVSFMNRLSQNIRRQDTFKRMRNLAEKETLESRYAVQWRDPIGEGSFGSVYLAQDRQTGEHVAVKKISKRATDDASFGREMEALLHIREHGGHPHVCGLRANYDQGDFYYLVLDLVSGGEMFDHLCNHGAYSEADAARLVREIASALAFLHGLNTVHGDLKPENCKMSLSLSYPSYACRSRSLFVPL